MGDEFYLPNGKFKLFDEDRIAGEAREIETGLPIKRHALHAVQLEFSHPVTDLWMEFKANLPTDFQQTLQYLRSQN